MNDSRFARAWFRERLIAIAAVAVLAVPNAAGATVPPFTGEFVGSGIEDGFPFDIRLDVREDPAGTFSGTASAVYQPEGDLDRCTFSGNIDTAGNLLMTTFTCVNTVDPNFTTQGSVLQGKFDGTKLVISYTGDELNGALLQGTVLGSFEAVLNAVSALSPGSAATGESTIREQTRQLVAALDVRQSAVREFLLGRAPATSGMTRLRDGFMFQHGAGQAAGDGFAYPWGLWGAVQYSEFEDDFAATAFDADRYAFYGGVDFSPWENFVFGVALAYDSSDINTSFNAGEQDIDGFTVAPYLGALLPDFGLSWDMTIDMSIGYGAIDIEQFRTTGGTRVTSNVDVDRLFITGNLNGTKRFGDLRADARMGFIVARDDHDAFTESDGTVNASRRFDLGQFRVGGDLAYSLATWEPFASLIYAYDYEREDVVVAGAAQPANDSDDFDLGVGLRWFGRNDVSASVEYHTILGREDFNSDSIQLLLRAQF